MEPLKHECGVVMVRLLKPLSYFQEKYGTWMYVLNKMYLLMEKQHNRGQEGAGMGCVKLGTAPGQEFMFRERAEGAQAITTIFKNAYSQINSLPADKLSDAEYAKDHADFAGELYMGHLRYSTTGKSGLSYVHPFMRRNNYRANNLLVCGNFNLTNVDEVFDMIVRDGQHPRHYADTFIILEQLGHRLDREVERLYGEAARAMIPAAGVNEFIENNISIENVLRESAPVWDGGYVICGLTGSGESFALRDPWGIRPAFYYKSDELVVLASERPVIQTAFDVGYDEVSELRPGQSLVVTKNGELRLSEILPSVVKKACSFERIYFSRGSDQDIYRERKQLGRRLVPDILESIGGDIANSVFAYIPNTAEAAFYGMVHGLNDHLNRLKSDAIRSHEGKLTPEFLSGLLSTSVRTEKVAIKDIKLRTFISEGNSRNELAAHVYDITYGSLRENTDNLVVIDDSIVRGTTLKQSIVRMMARLNPKKIVVTSSAPQIRYPDFYGIDMPSLEEFIAFKAMVELLRDNGLEYKLREVYEKSMEQRDQPKEWMVNYVKELYEPFTDKQISRKIAELVTPPEVKCPVDIIYQTVEGLHESCPGHAGDWYFTGDYPTPGGVKMVNHSFIRYYEKYVGGK